MRPSGFIVTQPQCRYNECGMSSKYDWRRLTYTGLLVTSVCCLLVILVGCRQAIQSTEVPLAPVSFEDLCRLSHKQFGTMGEEELRQWIEETYYDTPSEAQEIMDGDPIGIYIWEHGEMIGNAYLRDGRLLRISLHDIENGPTFGQVVAGLAPPAMVYRYQWTYEQVLYTIGLDYPALGVSVYTTNLEKWHKLAHQEGLAVTLTQDMRVNGIECYTPGPMEDVLREAFLLSPESVSFQMQSRLPWPGFGVLIPLDTP